MPLTRRRLVQAGGGAAAGLALGGGLDAFAQAASRPRNVVVVIIDNVRADYLGAYGAKTVRTPNIDAFARQGLRFTRFRPEAFPTIPVRRSIMTGRRVYPFRNSKLTRGLPQAPGWTAIDPSIPIFTDLLGRAGFHTGYVTDNPHILSPAYDRFRKRFDEPVRIKGQAPYRGRPPGRVSRRTVRRHTIPKLRGRPTQKRIREYLDANKGHTKVSDYLAPRVFTAASEWVTRASVRPEPFALVVDSFDPHEPWDPPDSYLRRYGKGNVNGVRPIQPFAPPGGSIRDLGLKPAGMRRIRNLYKAELTLVDAYFGRLMATLSSLGRLQDTLVVLVSDHGVLLGERGEIGKRDAQMHKEVTRPPLIIRDPAGRRGGSSSDYFASTHDIGPTVLRALGRPVPRAMDGVDLGALFAGRRPPRRSHQTASYGVYVSATDGRWLLISDNQGANKQLYDTRRDPGERRNVARQNPDTVRRLWRLVIKDAGGRPLPRF